MTLDEVPIGQTVSLDRVGGERAFRRRLMELGFVPGTRITMVGVAPMGDPLELSVRGAALSIRRSEARCIAVAMGGSAERAVVPARAVAAPVGPHCTGS
ncbi:MAG TPA: FeoA family protein [Polyangiaceae bacterium]|jgi:ferrous iron transport protein A